MFGYQKTTTTGLSVGEKSLTHFMRVVESQMEL